MLELCGTTRCPHTQEMREWLEWQRHDFTEDDVDADPTARRRLRDLTGGQRRVPVLIEGDKVIQVGGLARAHLHDQRGIEPMLRVIFSALMGGSGLGARRRGSRSRRSSLRK